MVDLEAESRSLRRRLKVLMRWAEDNEERMRRFQAQELCLLGINSLYELLLMLVHETRVKFHLDLITLALLDSDHDIRHLLQLGGVDLAGLPQVIFLDERSWLEGLFREPPEPRLGRYEAEIYAALLPPGATEAASIAVLPLVRNGRIVGTINFVSNDPERYRGTHSTDFLAHFGAVVGICLENALNHERLKRVGLTDTLTGVNNRRYFDQRFAEEIRRVQRGRRPLTCLFLDVDFFKRVNDGYGHAVGDLVLQDVARIIKTHLRDVDILARYGGEEFIALLPATGAREAARIAERIRIAVAQHAFTYAEIDPFTVTLSVGMATLEGDQPIETVDATGRWLVTSADQALYEAKQTGRNRVVVATAQAAVGDDLRAAP